MKEADEVREALTFCRICMGHCGMVASLDAEGKLLRLRGDHDDPVTKGYACFKGLQAVEAQYSPERILKPLKKNSAGEFETISYAQAYAEIADRLAALRDRHGGDSIGGYKGGGAAFNSPAVKMLDSFLSAVGSPKVFSSVTIDQSSKGVAVGRMGIWPAGRIPMDRADLFVIVGGNPLLSLTTLGFDTRNPAKRLKEAKARGMKLIVIDPRRTETATMADMHLQPLPGEDSAILACLIHIVLENGWYDEDFCSRFAIQMDVLADAVARFTPESVAARVGVEPTELEALARAFAKDSKTGVITSATGPDMAEHANLSEHLIECLNALCGRYLRAGDRIGNPGAIKARFERKEEVIPPPRAWDHGYKSRVGDYGLLDGELPTGIMAEEILLPGEGQIRAMIIHGGNPVLSVPDQQRIVEAFRSLELMVTIEPFMTATAQMSDYILPPTLQYERPDLPLFLYEEMVTPEAYTRYTPAITEVPPESELEDEAIMFWELARRMGLQLEHFGVPLDMNQKPELDHLLEIICSDAPFSFSELQAAERGLFPDAPEQYVQPGDPDSPGRLELCPEDIKREIDGVQHLPSDASPYRYRLAVRRLRDAMNSACKNTPSVKARLPVNYAFMNPADMVQEGIEEGGMVTLQSDHGEIVIGVKRDETVRTGVISVPHGFGGVPGNDPYDTVGASSNLLINGLTNRQTINAMPRMTGIPINVMRLS